MIPLDARLSSALEFLAQLTLPSGLTMGESFKTDSWLRDDIAIPVLSRQENGKPQFRYVWCELPKGAGKSTIAAALMLVEAAMEPATHCFITAVDADQARIILEALKGLISRSRRLKAAITQTTNLFTLSNGSFLKIMSSHEPSFHGIGAAARRTRFLLEEVTQWESPAMYHAILSQLAKHSDSQMLILTNAGLTDGWQLPARDQLKAAGAHMHVSQPGWLPSWTSPEDVEALKLTMPEPMWRRFFLNEWISGTIGQAISEADWDACLADIPALAPTVPLVLGVDAGIISDTFSVVGVSRSSGEDGKSELVSTQTYGFAMIVPKKKEAAKIAVRAVKIWTPSGTPLDFSEVYDWLAGFCRTHSVKCISFDGYQLHDFCMRFQREHQTWCEEFSQGPKRAQADVDLISLIRSGRLQHGGEPELREHVLNAALKMSTKEDTNGRFCKPRGSKKIDGIVSLSMACHQAAYLRLGQ